MTKEYFKILCVENGSRISKLTRSVYGSLRYLLETVPAEQDIPDVLKKRAANLLIIDVSAVQYNSADLRVLRQTNPQLYILIISEDTSILDDNPSCSHIKLIMHDELATKFPLILSDFYSDFTNGIYSGLGYGKLLKESLNLLSGMIITVDSDGEIIFMNHTAEDLLILSDSMYQNINFMDLLVDGHKSWKFIIENCCKSNSEPQAYLLKFTTAQHEELTKNMDIRQIKLEKPYLLLQEKITVHPDKDKVVEQELQLLEKFAESIANELLNPVNVISGRLQLLLGAMDKDSKSEKSLTAISKQVKRVDEIIAKLLTFARLKQDFIPQKIQLNDLLLRLKLEPSVSMPLQSGNIKLDFHFENSGPVIFGQIVQFDLLCKTLLEIFFDCLGSAGEITISTASRGEKVEMSFLLKYPQELYGDQLSLNSYMGSEPENTKQKSIETTIIKQIIRQYQGSFRLTRIDRDTEKLQLFFPVSRSIN